MREIIVCIIVGLCLIPTQFIAQSIAGIVYDEKNEPLSGVDILVFNAKVQLISNSITDKSGRFVIPIKDGITSCRVQHLGYVTEMFLLENIDFEKTLIVTLQPNEIKLAQIQVSSQKIKHESKGDTTSYNIRYYQNDTDRDLGDILQKLEGVDVANDGTITYEDRRIDKLLIEGKDILNDQHKLTIESIAPLDVKQIQIIKQYRPFHEQYAKRWSDKVAMNIVLTNKAKTKINGGLNGAVGIQRKYELESNAYTANKKQGYTGFVRSNNIGEQTLSSKDFLNIQSSLTRTLDAIDGQLENIIPSVLQESELKQKDSDNLLAFNIERDNSRLKTIANFSTLNNFTSISNRADISRVYTQNNTSYESMRTNDPQLYYSYSVVNTKTVLNKKSTLELDIPIEFIFQNIKTVDIGRLKTNFSLLNTKSNTKINCSPNIYYSNKISSSIAASVQAGYKQYNLGNEVNLSSESSLFGTKREDIRQNSDRFNKTMDISLILDYSKSNIRSGLKVELFHLKYNWNLSNVLDQQNSENNLGYETKINSFSPTLWLGYKTNKIWVKSTMELQFFDLRYDQESKKNRFLNPSFLLRYNFEKFKYLLFRVQSKDKMYSLDNYSGFTEVIDNNTLQRYYLPTNNDVQNVRTINVSFINIDIVNKVRWQYVISYSRSKNGLYSTAEIQDNYILNQYDIAERIHKYTFSAKLSKHIMQEKFVLTPSIRFNNYSALGRQILKLNTFSGRFAVRSNFKGLFNVQSAAKYTYSSQATNTIHNAFYIWQLDLSIDTRFQKLSFFMDSNYMIRANAIDRSAFIVFNLDVVLNHSSKWDFFVKSRDLLNLSRSEIKNFVINDFFIEQQSFIRFPGSIILGTSFKF